MQIVNLIGFELTVQTASGPVTIPAGSQRAVLPVLSGEPTGSLSVDVAGVIVDLPVVSIARQTADDIRLQPGNVPFPEPVEGVVYLATAPVRALLAHRSDVYGMGDLVDPRNKDLGVRYLIAPSV